MKNIIKTPSLAVLIGLIMAVSGHAQSFLTNGLVSYYPFNGNANDAFGTNNGTVQGAVLTTNRFGVTNAAYHFNGSSSYIDLGRPTNLQFYSNFTLSAWCLVSGGSAQNPRIISYCWGNGYELLTQGNGSSRAFQFISGNYSFNTTSNYSQGIWRAVATVYTNGICYFYVNGALVNSGANHAPVSFTNNLHIGNNSGTTSWDWWGGSIDDIRFYSRALSTNEVQMLYQYEAGGPQLSSAAVVLQLSTTNLVVGGSYQIQMSTNLVTWSNYGTPFIATSTNAPQYVNMKSSQGYFRILAAP
jgi:hypothetical protein